MKKILTAVCLLVPIVCFAGPIIKAYEDENILVPLTELVASDASNFADYPQTITVTNTGTASDTTFTYTGMVENRPAYGIGGTNYI